MANLIIKGMDDNLYAQLKSSAASENRSIGQQVLFILESYLAKKHQLQETKTPAEVLLGLAGSWKDDRPATQIIKELKAGRKSSA